jgi:hypothetical protein
VVIPKGNIEKKFEDRFERTARLFLEGDDGLDGARGCIHLQTSNSSP